MTKWSLLFLALALVGGCAATEPEKETVPASSSEIQETKKEYEHLTSSYIRGKAGVVCRAYSDYDELKGIVRSFEALPRKRMKIIDVEKPREG